MSELKPCPFCGSDKVKIADVEFTDQIECPNCGYITSPKRWNSRPLESAARAEGYKFALDKVQDTFKNMRPSDEVSVEFLFLEIQKLKYEE